jgi:hypothetical protein
MLALRRGTRDRCPAATAVLSVRADSPPSGVWVGLNTSSVLWATATGSWSVHRGGWQQRGARRGRSAGRRRTSEMISWYSTCCSSWASVARPMAMTGDNAIAPLGALVLGGLEIAGKVPGDGDIGVHLSVRIISRRSLSNFGRDEEDCNSRTERVPCCVRLKESTMPSRG